MRLTLLLLLTSFVTFGQESRYFTPYFQTMTSEKTKFERIYNFQDGQTQIEDYNEQKIEHKASIFGISKIDEVNAFAWYCISQGNEIHYREYFKNAKAVFDFYDNGKMAKQLIIHGSIVKYGQVWDKEGKSVLINGSGKKIYMSDEMDEEIQENYKDSTLLVRYGIRVDKKDTIYYTYDKMANPKEGLQNFYQSLAKVLKYPGIARLVGKEGRVYVQFVVDEKGKLTDFKPLTKEGFRFEARAVKRLEEFPNWNPALLKNRAVKTKFVLPVKFELTD
jgi:TonB family protein